MSKKKSKTRIEKQLTTHRLDHVARYSLSSPGEASDGETKSVPSNKRALSPQNALIGKDLRNTIIVIGCFVLIVAVLGVVAYMTELVNPLLARWNIKY